jgi:hypothetical protein
LKDEYLDKFVAVCENNLECESRPWGGGGVFDEKTREENLLRLSLRASVPDPDMKDP